MLNFRMQQNQSVRLEDHQKNETHQSCRKWSILQEVARLHLSTESHCTLNTLKCIAICNYCLFKAAVVAAGGKLVPPIPTKPEKRRTSENIPMPKVLLKFIHQANLNYGFQSIESTRVLRTSKWTHGTHGKKETEMHGSDGKKKKAGGPDTSPQQMDSDG